MTDTKHVNDSQYSLRRYLICNRLPWYDRQENAEYREPLEQTHFTFSQSPLALELYLKTLGTNLSALNQRYSSSEENQQVKQTQDFLKNENQQVLTTAMVNDKHYTARADLLVRLTGNSFSLSLVRPVLHLRDVDYKELALAISGFQKSGFPIEKAYLVYLNKNYRKGMMSPKRLFMQKDALRRAETSLSKVEKWSSAYQADTYQAHRPETQTGKKCLYPRPCVYLKHCMEKPEEAPVKFTPLTKPSIQAPDKLEQFLSSIQYPLFFLDFESFQTPVPLYNNVKPFQMVVFQYSLHIKNSPESPMRHISFLAREKGDPRPEWFFRLKNQLGKKGSILAYNATFEMDRIKDCSDHFGEKHWFNQLKKRFVDLWQPFKEQMVLHPDQNNKSSLKVVLPLYTGETYEDLSIKDGYMAAQNYINTHLIEASESIRMKVRHQLEDYCRKDTIGMVDLLKSLYNLSETQTVSDKNAS